MSKDQARSPKSYENEQLLLDMLPDLLETHGFTAVSTTRSGGMKFVDARTPDGSKIRFWLKQGWTDTRMYSAIQLGMFETADAAGLSASYFIDYVLNRVASAKAKGATHALLVHMVDSRIVNFVALEVDDVTQAYRQQMAEWPKRARNSKTPTLWFEDARDVADADCISVVTRLELSLSTICGLSDRPKGAPGSKKITAELEVRMRQQAFRQRVGHHYKWCCVVSGTDVRAVLDAAHLPGKNWRQDNEAEDGILIRTDLHRLLDRGLAEIRSGRFWVSKSARVGVYSDFHNRQLEDRSIPAALKQAR